MLTKKERALGSSASGLGVKEDVWVQTVCDYCNGNCGIRVHRVDGVVVGVEGDPDCPQGAGRLCAKGQAEIIGVYDPYRVLYPMKRTNPKKGVGIDPGWQRISWEEALGTIVDKMKKIRADSPRKLLWASWDVNGEEVMGFAWANAFGAVHGHIGSGTDCGTGIHPITYIINGTFQQEVDVSLCNYLILAGTNAGFAQGVSANNTTQNTADARVRGLKVVVIDPVGASAAAKADEWIPIRPGTDGALFLAMANVILNELGIYDAEFIKNHTNGIYLIDPQGNYVRDKASHKPLVWDSSTETAVTFDTPVANPALEGTYVANGVECRPGFQLLKDHVKGYTPEGVVSITTVPAEVTRRIAREFAEAARVGSTIVIDGKQLPYRPAALNLFKGVTTHAHAWLSGQAGVLLNLIVGSFFVPGSYRGVNIVGPFGKWWPTADEDGMLISPPEVSKRENYYEHKISQPQSLSYHEMMPFAGSGNYWVNYQNITGKGYAGRKPAYQPEIFIRSRWNRLSASVNPAQVSEFISSIPFVVSFAQEMDQLTDWSDIILPDTHQLERLSVFPHRYRISMSAATKHFFWGFQVPVLPPAGECRDWRDVFIELADRVGFLSEFNTAMNLQHKLNDEDCRLKAGVRYSWEEICDRISKAHLGPDKGLESFKKHGYLKIKKTVEEEYPGPFIKARAPLYCEIIKRRGDDARAMAEKLGFPWDTSDYVGLPVWKPCPAYKTRSEEYDLFVRNFKVPMHFHSVTSRNPLLVEVALHSPYTYKILLNTQTARKKGIKDGDMIWVESKASRVKGMVKVTECVHPEVVGIAHRFGEQARHPIFQRGRGVSCNELLSLADENVDKITGAVDSCENVKVYKA